MVEILSAVAATVAIVTGGTKLASWIKARREARRELERRAASADAQPAFPVRMKCVERDDFHPQNGYHSIMQLEVFNHSDRPVSIKGFGLEVRLRQQASWTEDVRVRKAPPSFEWPVRLEPHDAIEGFIDTEGVAEDYATEGTREFVEETKPFVEVAGFGRLYVEPEHR